MDSDIGKALIVGVRGICNDHMNVAGGESRRVEMFMSNRIKVFKQSGATVACSWYENL
jgi:hypothetical protein